MPLKANGRRFTGHRVEMLFQMLMHSPFFSMPTTKQERD